MLRGPHAAASLRALAGSMRFVSLTASYEQLVAGIPERRCALAPPRRRQPLPHHPVEQHPDLLQ
jgi:hypothetical protein